MVQTSLPVGAKSFSNQIFIDSEGLLWTGRAGKYMLLAAGAGGLDFVTVNTDQLGLTGNKEWLGMHHFEGALAIPRSAPVAPEEGKVYIWAGEGTGGDIPAGGDLESLANVADLIDTGKFLFKGPDGIWVGVDMEAAQTLSVPALGQLSISGGNTVEITGLRGQLHAWNALTRNIAYFNTNSVGAIGGLGTMHGIVIPHQGSEVYGTSLIFRNNRGFFQSLENGLLLPWQEIATQNWVKSHGLGSLAFTDGWSYTSLLTLSVGNAKETGFIGTGTESPNGAPAGFTWPFGIHVNVNASIRGDIIISHSDNRLAFRSGGRDFSEVWSTSNFNPQDFTAGMIVERFRDPSFQFGMNNIAAYPNSTGTVIARVADTSSPSGLAIRYTATAWQTSNSRITFVGLPTDTGPYRTFVVRLVARIPIGWQLWDNHNSIGSGAVRHWITSREGTGQYTEYLFRLQSGGSGTFSTANYFDLRKSSSATPNPTTSNPVISYLAFATVIETTESFINTRLRIPTTSPTWPLPGDLWVM